MFLLVIYTDTDSSLKNDIVNRKFCNCYSFEKDFHSGNEKLPANLF